MGILNFGKRVGVGAAERLGRAPASIMSSKAAMGAIGVGALALGFQKLVQRPKMQPLGQLLGMRMRTNTLLEEI
jgi:hypothetical protein